MEKEKRTFRVLTINPGSTSTKIGVFDDEECILEKVVRHDRAELEACGGLGVLPQKDLRKKLVLETLKEEGIDLKTLDAASGRAGRLPAMPGGTYRVNDDLWACIPDPLVSAALLGMIISKEIGDELGIPSFIVDPGTTDEAWDVAKVTGFPEIKRTIMVHALNQKAVARRYAESIGKRYDEVRIIVAHVGGGISIGAHLNGQIVDCTCGGVGEGPFTPERCGSVQGIALTRLCFSGKMTQQEIEARFLKAGGAYAYLGTSDMREVEKMVKDGNEKAALVFEAMTYNVAKAIGSMFAVLNGEIDGIVISGGLAYSEKFTEMVKDHVAKFGAVEIYPGEEELLALAQGALRVLKGEEEAKLFKKETES